MKTKQFNPSKSKLLLSLVALFFILTASNCKKKDPTPPEPGNDEELITTCKLVFTDTLGKQTSYFFKDPDGDGGAAPFYGPDGGGQTDSVIVLAANKYYEVEIILLDESKNPVSVISDEVARESKEHMLFFNPQTALILNNHPDYKIELPDSKLQIAYKDKDNGSPVLALGLKTAWRTSNNGKFPLTIVLRHQPDVKDGSFAPGDTDLSVNFKYQVQ